MARAEAIYACKLKQKSNINNTARRKVCNWFLIFAKRAPCERGLSLSLLPDCPVSRLPAPPRTHLSLSAIIYALPTALSLQRLRGLFYRRLFYFRQRNQKRKFLISLHFRSRTHTPTSKHLHMCYTHTHMQRQLICITCKWELCRATKGSPRNEK